MDRWDQGHEPSERIVKLDAELHAVREIIVQLDPLPPYEQARVMLLTILKYAPNAFPDAYLLQLVQRAKQPPEAQP